MAQDFDGLFEAASRDLLSALQKAIMLDFLLRVLFLAPRPLKVTYKYGDRSRQKPQSAHRLLRELVVFFAMSGVHPRVDCSDVGNHGCEGG